jgi:tetratricopeptide (TPR) repeat protein
MVSLGVGALLAASAAGQTFSGSKEKVTLHRKLPAIVHLPGDSIKVSVTSADEDGALPYDFQAMLETELLKDSPNLRIDDSPSSQIICQITEYSHPDPIYTKKAAPGLALGTSGVDLTKSATKQAVFVRITGEFNVAFQAKTGDGKMLISDNVHVNYDREFDSAGNSTSKGVVSQFTGTFGHMKGGQSNEDSNPPTPAELRSRLIQDAVQQIAEHVVNSDEAVEVFLARGKGTFDEGDKEAETGLWERALETFETAPAAPKPADDAYRLYNIGVAYEALAYQADDEKTTMKYLDQAAINYGKAIDAKPDEKYFVGPQKRIETAIAHYKELDREKEAEAAKAKAAALEAAAPKPPPALTNDQVITMVKSGMADDTIIHAIRGAEAVNFDLTTTGQHALTTAGVGPRVLVAMKTQAAKKPTPKPGTHKGLNNTQIIAMVKSGIADSTVVEAINGAGEIDFDLTPAGQQQLTSSGVSAQILAAMKARAAKKPATATTKPVAQK